MPPEFVCQAHALRGRRRPHAAAGPRKLNLLYARAASWPEVGRATIIVAGAMSRRGDVAKERTAVMTRLLIIEDQRTLLGSLTRGLREVGYTVSSADSVAAAETLLETEEIDAMLLDLMLPDRSGLDWLRELRQGGFIKPVVIITARDTVRDRVQGLDVGADDYLVKPFSFDELLARLRAVLRRSGGSFDTLIRVADLELDLLNRRSSRGMRIGPHPTAIRLARVPDAQRRRAGNAKDDRRQRVERPGRHLDQRGGGADQPPAAQVERPSGRRSCTPFAARDTYWKRAHEISERALATHAMVRGGAGRRRRRLWRGGLRDDAPAPDGAVRLRTRRGAQRVGAGSRPGRG